MTTLRIPSQVVSTSGVEKTASSIARTQLSSGAIPWFEDHLLDPWDHVEAAMGLSIAGFSVLAEKAYRYLARLQEGDGSFWPAYADTVPLDTSRRETHHSAYLATGVWHHFLVTGDRKFLLDMWPHVCAGLDFACNMQNEHGEIPWALDGHGQTFDDALVTGCCSIYKSLECGFLISRKLGKDRKEWLLVRQDVGQAIRNKPERFDRTWESKARYSMDWFYPVLCGVLSPRAARSRLLEKWKTFVHPGLGCRCVSDQPWFTVAETCELIMSLIAAGSPARAAALFADLNRAGHEDGSFWTGYQSQLGIFWPQERPTWTAGAVILAADALASLSPAAHLFTADDLGIDRITSITGSCAANSPGC